MTSRPRRTSTTPTLASRADPDGSASPPVIKAGSPADVLAAVPYELGFHPERSLVVISLRGPRHQVGLVCRFDLPEPTEQALVCERALALLQHDGARSAFLVVYDSAGPTTGGPPRRHLVRQLRTGAARAGIEIKDALHVGSERYRSYLCSDRACCPLGGRPLSDLEASAVGPAFVAAGVAPVPRREDLRAQLLGDDDQRIARVRALADICSARLGGEQTLVVLVLERWCELQRLDADDETFDRPAAFLLDACVDTGLRDAVLRDLLADPATPGRVTSSDPHVVSAALSGLCRLARGRQALAPLTMLALHTWLQGSGALANLAVELALETAAQVGSAYPLADTLGEVLAAGVPPPGYTGGN